MHQARSTGRHTFEDDRFACGEQRFMTLDFWAEQRLLSRIVGFGRSRRRSQARFDWMQTSWSGSGLRVLASRLT